MGENAIFEAKDADLVGNTVKQEHENLITKF